MAEETNVIESQPEVVGLANQPGETTKNLASLFDKMETAKSEGGSADSVIKQEVKPEPKTEVKAETKPEPKKEDKQEAKDEPKDDKPDDPREVLRRAMEERAEQKKDDKKKEEVKTKEEPAVDDVTDDDLKVLPHDKPKTAKRIQALLKKIEATNSEFAKTKTERDEKASKLAELEKKLNETPTIDPKTQEEINKAKDELAMYRRRYDLDSDPEVKSKFDGRAEEAEKSIVASLKQHGASEALLNIIKEEGGWSGFSGSNRAISVPDGEGGTRQISGAELADAILQKLPVNARKSVEAAMIEQVQVKRDRDRFFKEEVAKANDYFKKRDEDGKKLAEAQQAQVKEAEAIINEWKKKVVASDWLTDKTPGEKATAEEKAAVENHNKYNSQLRSLVDKALGTKDLNGMLEIVFESVKYYDERRTSNALRKENEKLRAEIEARDNAISKFKNGGRSVNKSGSIAVAPVQESQESRKPKSLEEAFDMRARGEKLDGSGDTDE